jgi:hypothetical protein
MITKDRLETMRDNLLLLLEKPNNQILRDMAKAALIVVDELLDEGAWDDNIS